MQQAGRQPPDIGIAVHDGLLGGRLVALVDTPSAPTTRSNRRPIER
jgi:hypothetical protein